MVEIEVKYPVVDFGPILQKLEDWGASVEPPRQEADQYFNAPDRDFARTDEALRIRRIGTTNRVTYKGPKLDAQTKTRTEIEVALAEGEPTAADFARLLEKLGYRPVLVVHKERTCYHLQRQGFTLEVTLDTVAGLGRYVELEILALEKDLDAARQVLLQAGAELGLTTSERRSYLELLLQFVRSS